VPKHMKKYYKCGLARQDDLKKFNNIHYYCKHTHPNTLKQMNEHRRLYMGNLDLYRNPNNFINSIPSYHF